MRKLNTDSKKLNILRFFDDFATAEGTSLQNEQSHEALLQKFTDALAEHRKNPIALYGQRVQSMFAYVAGALGECVMITEEDAGLFLAEDSALRRPDFHIVTRSGEKFFVEVKNHSPDKLSDPFEMTISYASRIQRYADLCGRPLKIAIYWRHLGMWTLVGTEFFDRERDKWRLTPEAAFFRNEMSSLGDRMLGTVPPLALRFYTDIEKSNRIGPDGKGIINLHRIVICAAGQEIEDPVEQKIAMFLFLHGSWSDFSKPVEIKDGEVLWFDFQLAPEVSKYSEQGVDLIGSLSEMISKQYRDSTLEDGKVASLSPNKEPCEFGVIIPAEYSGKVLRLVRLHVEPNYDGFVGAGSRDAVSVES